MRNISMMAAIAAAFGSSVADPDSEATRRFPKGRRVRSPGKKPPAGSKLARMAAEGRVGLRLA